MGTLCPMISIAHGVSLILQPMWLTFVDDIYLLCSSEAGRSLAPMIY